MTDEDYMKRAIELAKKGEGHTDPNPLVGAVIVKNGKIIGEGYHEKYGGLHAERNALKNCTESPEDATIYVTLEPCCHYGKQPPCSLALIDAGIKKVVIGSRDPNPLVSGKGVMQLREAGIEVVTDFLKEECDALNEVFFCFMKKKRPYVVLKYAMSADGKITDNEGRSKWITGDTARGRVHKLRNKYAGILAGIETVLADDPMLNVRGIEDPAQPVRIILDTNGKIPIDCKLVKTAKEIPVTLACARIDAGKKQLLTDLGVKVLILPNKEGKVDLNSLLKALYEEKIDSVLVEGGGRVNGSFLTEGLFDKVYAFIGGMLLGGEGKNPIAGSGVALNEAIRLIPSDIKCFDNDVLIEYRVLD